MLHITAELTSGTRVTLSNGRHKWNADEPTEAGGDDSGPTPYELLIGALASCTCITLALYCRHKGIALKAITARYEHEKFHAKDCTECEDPKAGYIDFLRSKVRIAGDFDDAQRKRLSQIVSRCPVHKTLENGAKMVDEVEFA